MLININNSLKVTFLNFYRHNSKIATTNLKKLLENMPKETKHIADVQRVRMKIKERNQKYVPGKVTLQVLGTGAEGAPKALYMFTDQSRYLFNCGEGTQRLAHEHKMKLAKLEHIFITTPTWDNIGGLPGVALTIQDVGVPQITLHGPEGLDELFIATKRFVVLKDLTIRMAECKEEDKFEDNVMSVTYVPIRKGPYFDDENEKSIQAISETSDASTSTRSKGKRNRSRSKNRGSNNLNNEQEDDTDYYAYETSGTRTISPTLLNDLYIKSREQEITMCYICRLNPKPGSLSLEKCVEKGIPPGPLLGLLKAGKSVTLRDGTTVYTEDVCLPDDPGPVIIVVDCPNEDYIDSLVLNKSFEKHQLTATSDEDLTYCVVHFSPSHVMQDLRYQKWIEKFSMSTQHIALNDNNNCMGSESVHRIQYKLNMLHSNMFPLLGDNGTEIRDENFEKLSGIASATKKIKMDVAYQTTDMIENLKVNSDPSAQSVIIQPNTLCNIYLRPKRGLDRSEELHLIPSQYIEETMNVDGFGEIYEELIEKLNNLNNRKIREYPRILFLGTGSCIPNKTRNTSGILVETSEKSAFLMDCGEGTYGQIVRFFGLKKAEHLLCNLKGVYISHLHADHHIGLIGLLKGRRRAIDRLNIKEEDKPLLLMAPRQILTWLNFYNRRFEDISDEFELVPNGDMILGDKKLTEKRKEEICEKLEIKDVSTVLVKHCPNAFGVSFVHKSGWKLTYSGDTMPSEALIELGANSDILIHEATMEDALVHEAVSKMHSTTSQAISAGRKMSASFIILTHFSQRYAKLPRFNENFDSNVGIAFDNMQVRLDDLPVVPLLYPALKLMFAEHYEELEQKAVKRQLKKQRQESV